MARSEKDNGKPNGGNGKSGKGKPRAGSDSSSQESRNGRRKNGTFAPGNKAAVNGNRKRKTDDPETWADLIKEYADKPCPEDFKKQLNLPKNAKWKHVVVAMAFRHAAKGNERMLNTIFDRTEGKVPVKVDIRNKLKSVLEKNGYNAERIRGNPVLAAIAERYGLPGIGEN